MFFVGENITFFPIANYIQYGHPPLQMVAFIDAGQFHNGLICLFLLNDMIPDFLCKYFYIYLFSYIYFDRPM